MTRSPYHILIDSPVAGRAFGDIVTAHASLRMFAEALEEPSLAVDLLALLDALCGNARSSANRDSSASECARARAEETPLAPTPQKGIPRPQDIRVPSNATSMALKVS